MRCLKLYCKSSTAQETTIDILRRDAPLLRAYRWTGGINRYFPDTAVLEFCSAGKKLSGIDAEN